MAKRTLAIFFIIALAAPALALPLPGIVKELTGDAPALNVRIDRDDFGVPHIYANDSYSLFWGNGYVQAEDRLFQMDVLRHVGFGDSAQYLGPSQLPMDLATRRELYTDEERTARFDALPAEHQAMFQAFADGVNAYIDETRKNPLLLSAEFYAIGHEPEYWVPEDTVAIAEFLLDIFGAGSGGNEVENARLLVDLIDTLGMEDAEKAFNDFFWMHDANSFTTVPANEGQYVPTEGPLAFADIPALQWELIYAAAGSKPFAGEMTLSEAAQAVGLPTKFGSNALVVSPQFAESGNALLLGGPQMAYHNPMIPYEVGLHGAGFEALGMGVGGAPGVIIGRASDYSWTVTSGSSDQVDVVAHKLVAGSPRQYYADDGVTVLDMDCRIETHFGPPTAIDANPPVLAVQEVCRTERGPVFAMNEEAGYAFVRERTHRLDELRSGILWLTLGQSETLQEFQDHMETFRFEFNFLVATDDGDIAYFHFGGQPVRASGYDPRLPRMAGVWDWTEIRTGSQLPHIVNPEQGYLVNWNNRPAQGWSAGDAMEKWGPANRVTLFEDTVLKFIEADGKLSVADLQAINVEISTRSPYTKTFVPEFKAAADRLLTQYGATDPAFAAEMGAVSAEFQSWADAGYGWDHYTATSGEDRYVYPAFYLYEKARSYLQDFVLRDELGTHMRVLEWDPPATSDPHAADHGREDNKDNVIVNAMNARTGLNWWDDVTTLQVETMESRFESAVLNAMLDGEIDFGNVDPSTWNMPIRQIKFIALSGGPGWQIPMVNRPSFNHLYDWGTGYAGSVLPPGTNQSWKPLEFLKYSADGIMPDAHKRDQLDLYTSFTYKPAQMTPAVLESSRTFGSP